MDVIWHRCWQVGFTRLHHSKDSTGMPVANKAGPRIQGIFGFPGTFRAVGPNYVETTIAHFAKAGLPPGRADDWFRIEYWL
jgi:hypothetical protein